MLKSSKLNLSTSAWLSLALIITIVFFRFVYPPVYTLSWDVFGYYLYLPATFIYHDLRLADLDWVHKLITEYQTTATFYQATATPEGNWVMKYSLGMALLNAPGFFIAHIFSLVGGYKADGFSLPYQYAWAISGLVYTAIGIWMFRKVLLQFFNDRLTSILLVIVVLATNYFQLTAFEGYLSHNYLFTLYAFIIWYTIRWHQQSKWQYALGLGVSMGLAILVRPSEMVCLLIPLLWGISNKSSFNEKLELLKSHFRDLVIVAVALVAVGMPQLLYWKYSSGHWLFYSYNNAGEGFDFARPYILKVLFSFRKGWFIYTPVMLFAVAGFFSLYRKNKALFYSILLYFVVNLYIVSSWTCWWYAGGSYSQRALLSSYVLLAIPLGYLIQESGNWKKQYRALLTLAISFMLLLNIFQTWQWTHGVIDRLRMTKPYYFAVFGKTSVTDADRKLLLIERSTDGVEKLTNESDYTRRTAAFLDFENQRDTGMPYSSDTVYSGKYAQRLDESHPYSSGFEAPYSQITAKDHAWLRLEVMVFPVDSIDENTGSLVITVLHKGENYGYRAKSVSLKEFAMKPRSWNRMSMDYLTPEVRSTDDVVKIYFWLQGKKPVLIDNLKIDIYE